MGSKIAISFLVLFVMSMVVDVYGGGPYFCDSPWVESSVDVGICLRQFRRRKSFNKARLFCQMQGGDLATTLYNTNDMDVVLDKKRWRKYWIGFVYDNVFLGPVDINGFPVVDPPFMPGREFGVDPTEECVSIKDKLWVAKECSRKSAFVCAKSKS